jgi:signal transduction histidine kinase
LSVTIALSTIVSTGAAVAYAADPVRRIARWVPAVGVAAVAAVFAVAVWALATAADPDAAVSAGSLGDLGLVTRIFLATAVAFVACGVLGDLRPAVARTGVRMALEARRSLGVGGTVMYAGRWGRTFADELRPGRTQALEAARAERARIARDLHAVVVPDLRRAIREADAGGSVEHLAGSLRDALREVEAMMETRDVVGLEVGGLVPALESLAERVEDRSDVRVAIDVADDGSQDAGLPPVRVAAAALRVAALALENVMRHAPAARVRLLVASGPERVRVTIEDDGPGVRPDAASSALEEGRRGLADMVTEASLCGASLRSSRGEAGTGTIVAFDWPAG